MFNELYIPTQRNSLDDLTGEFLLHTSKTTGLMIPEVRSILRDAIQLATSIISKGHPCRTPLGLLGIVLIPEDGEFSDLQGIRSKLFFKQQLLPWLIDEDCRDWGYDYIPSGRINRSLRKALKVPKCAQKIQASNETSIFRWNHFKSQRRTGE